MRSTLAVVIVGASLAECRSTASTDAPVPSAPSAPAPSASASAVGVAVEPRESLPDTKAEWCLEGWRSLDEATCYVVPETFTRAERRTLLVYLSGIVPPQPRSPQKENVEHIVRVAATRARAVALLPRGRRGIGPKDARDWWAWPTTSADYAEHARAMVSEWTAAQRRLESALGHFDRVYLAGSSSGAYFLSALVFSGAIAMDGYAAISGGSRGLMYSAANLKKAPIYVGYGSADPTNGGPKALAAFLGESRWPHRVVEHPGGHGAREVYLDEAFRFWSESEASP
jgi:predicted esterase